MDQDLDNRIQSWNVFFDTYEDYFLMMIYVLGICLPENIHGQKIYNSWSICNKKSPFIVLLYQNGKQYTFVWRENIDKYRNSG